MIQKLICWNQCRRGSSSTKLLRTNRRRIGYLDTSAMHSAGFCRAHVLGICLRCEPHHGSKYCSEPLVRNELSQYFVAVHRSRTMGFITQNHVFYNTEEERYMRSLSKGIHVTTLSAPSLSFPDLRYRLRLTYPDYPRLT